MKQTETHINNKLYNKHFLLVFFSFIKQINNKTSKQQFSSLGPGEGQDLRADPRAPGLSELVITTSSIYIYIYMYIHAHTYTHILLDK